MKPDDATPPPRRWLIDDWKGEISRLWSLQVSLFLLGIKGMLAVIMVFAGELNPWLILGVSVTGTVILGIARLMKQESKPDGHV